MQELNTQLWNLGTTSFVAALGLSAAACGPAVALEGDTDGAETEGSSDTIIDPSTPTDTDPTGPTQGGCDSPDDCPSGFYCGPDGQCIEEYDCYDYGCYCVYGHCSPGYDCYDDEDCGSGELCQGYDGCDPVQSLSDCGTPATLVGTPLQIPTGNPIEALSFVDVDPQSPGEDLVAGTDTGGWLLPSGGEAVELPSEGAVRGAASADLDADGSTDLILIDDAGLSVHYGFGTETPQTVSLPTQQPFTAVHALQNVEGLPSLALLDAAGAVSVVAGSSDRTLELTPTRIPADPNASIEAFALGDGADGVVWEGSSGVSAALYTPSSQVLDSIGQLPRAGTRSMVVGSLVDSERSDVLWSSNYVDWTLLEVSIGGETPALRAIYFDYNTLGIGDLDGNGFDEALAVGEGGLAVMPGDVEWGVTCFSHSPFVGGASRLLAMGDLDGDGSDEAIIVTDAGGPPVQYDVSWTP
ncbi:MAG: hypothetical protein ACRBN8_00480 [Nannocystales bacterium]